MRETACSAAAASVRFHGLAMNTPRESLGDRSRRSLAGRAGLSLAFLSLVTLASIPACSQGEGEGTINGTLNVPNCWTGAFELRSDFFAAIPYRDRMLLRIQSGSDFENFSDGLTILIHDITTIRPNPDKQVAGHYREPLSVDLPPEVTPPGTPITPNPNPAPVSMALYLQRTCRTQTVTLQAVSEVSVPADGTCTVQTMRGADPSKGCAPDQDAPEGVGTGKSLIAFTSIANGNLTEETAAERLNAGCFDVYLADPREAAPGGVGPPPPCRGHIRGTFSFFFERGRPSQPFP